MTEKKPNGRRLPAVVNKSTLVPIGFVFVIVAATWAVCGSYEALAADLKAAVTTSATTSIELKNHVEKSTTALDDHDAGESSHGNALKWLKDETEKQGTAIQLTHDAVIRIEANQQN